MSQESQDTQDAPVLSPPPITNGVSQENNSVNERSPAYSSLHISAAPDRNAYPPSKLGRSIRAYLTTFRVISSYLWIRFLAKFRDPDIIQRKLKRAHLRNAKRIEKTILRLQGLFIKVGQLISIMTNFLPEEFRKQLEALQDHVPPRPISDIKERLAEEFPGQALNDLFHEFVEVPIASASIGQVHLARLHDGTKVAVKVQYPGIEDIVRRDLLILKRIFRIVGIFVKYRGLDAVYREVRSMTLAELDYRVEAENGTRIAAQFADKQDVVFPQVVPNRSTSRVLTSHFEPGCKVSDIAKLTQQNINRTSLARRIIELYCQQIFVDGMFHADPHPGNILIRPAGEPDGDPEIVFLDFGAVARIPPGMRLGLAELVQGAVSRDTQRVLGGLHRMGFVAKDADEELFDKIVEFLHSRFHQEISLDSLNLKDIKFDPQKSLEGLADLRSMNISLRELTSQFHVPKEWILLERTLLLLMGLCTELDPSLNPTEVIRPYVEEIVLGENGDWSDFAVKTGKDLLLGFASLPSDVRRFLKKAEDGKLRTRIDQFPQTAQLLYRTGQQLVWGMVTLGAVGAAILFENYHQEMRANIAWGTAAAGTFFFLWNTLLTRRWSKRF